ETRREAGPWVAGDLGGFSYVQFITLDLDFLCVHLYSNEKKPQEDRETLEAFAVGKTAHRATWNLWVPRLRLLQPWSCAKKHGRLGDRGTLHNQSWWISIASAYP
ncbi:MAG: hypothetical protein NT049_12880, partial [Planctomycetota bacterium]|nr:hypothetical protein [Planctomycetota bacterium]